MESVEYYDILRDISKSSDAIDDLDLAMHVSYDKLRLELTSEIDAILIKVGTDGLERLQERFILDVLSPLDTIIERVVEIRITKEVLLSQLYKTLEDENIRYEKTRAMSLAKKNLDELLLTNTALSEEMDGLCVSMHQDKLLLTKTWVDTHLLKVRDNALFERCDELAALLSDLSEHDSQWSDLTEMIKEIHTRRDRIESMLHSQNNTAEVSVLFNQIIHKEIQLLAHLLDDVVRYCELHKLEK